MATQASREIAKQRLHNMLMRDRSDVSAEVMEMLRDDIIAASAEYFELGDEKSQIYLSSMTNEETQLERTVLVCVIPINRVNAVDVMM